MVKTGCFFPFYLKKNPQPIPCGKCPLCRKRNVNGWIFRTLKQLNDADTASFITLTYNRANLPYTRSGFMALRKQHIQLFFKRLRKAHEPKKKALRGTSRGRLVSLSNKRVTGNKIMHAAKPIKYLVVGEYGGRTFRPHYHLLLFNCKVELIQEAWKNPVNKHHMGSVHYGNAEGVGDKSAAYCLAYLNKPYVKQEKWDDRPKEFKLVSKGFGLSYLSDDQIAWHMADLSKRMYCVLPGGRKLSMPRYYKEKIYSTLQKEKIQQYQTELLIKQQLDELMRIDAKTLLSNQRSYNEYKKAEMSKMYRTTTKHKV